MCWFTQCLSGEGIISGYFIKCKNLTKVTHVFYPSVKTIIRPRFLI